jgi:hypothetical protein
LPTPTLHLRVSEERSQGIRIETNADAATTILVPLLRDRFINLSDRDVPESFATGAMASQKPSDMAAFGADGRG